MTRLNLKEGGVDQTGRPADLQRFAAALTQSALESAPYDHRIVADAFDEAFLDTLRAAYPDPDTMPRVHDRRAGQRQSYSKDRYAITIPQPGDPAYRDWAKPFQRLSGLLRSPQAVGGLLKAFWGTIGPRVAAIGAQEQVDLINVLMEVEIVLDRSGFSLNAHTDGQLKLLTGLIYLPLPGDDEDLGTRVFEPLDPALSDGGDRYLPLSAMRTVKTAPYRRNTMLLFARSDRSFHGVMPTPPGAERRLVQFSLAMATAGPNAGDTAGASAASR